MPFELPAGIYGITAEKLSGGRSNLAVAEAMIRGGVRILQYREKYHEKTIREIYEECLALRDLTRKHGVLFIVNDFIDIALLVDADGVHVGQDDLPVPEVRKLMGSKIIGVSTHAPEHLAAAERDGADYVGVGPIFATQTKENVCAPVGLPYLEYAMAHTFLPLVPIGGIKEHNMDEVLRLGAKCVCLVSDIVGADDVEAKTRRLTEMIKNLEPLNPRTLEPFYKGAHT